MECAYRIVDVFTSTLFEGNGLAVFPDARGIAPELMQRIAREFNLSETTFVLPPERSDCAARVRIFTPGAELPFAGHPTLGTAAVLRRERPALATAERILLEEGVGPVAVRFDAGGLIWLTSPPVVAGAAFERAACATAIGLAEGDLLPGVPCRVMSAGSSNLFVALRDAATVDAARPDAGLLQQLLSGQSARTSVFVFAPVHTGAYSRMFAPMLGIWEDPATGSATAPLAAFMIEHGLAPAAGGTRFVSEQGTQMGRRSLLHVLIHGERGSEGIEVGGHVTFCAEGRMQLP
jgi:trans-2,3-dihydro-3-hydroxyanthranilate isomerase